MTSVISAPGGVDLDATMPIPVRAGRRRRETAHGVATDTLLAMAQPMGDPAGVELLLLVPGASVLVRGRLDVRTVADVRALLHEAVDAGSGELLVDLSGAEVGDATGLGVLVGAHHRARRAGRRLVLVDVSARLDRLLRGARLHRVLTVR